MNNNWEFDYSELYNNNNPGRNAQNTTAPEAESPLQGAPGPAGMPGMGVGGAPVPPHAAQKKRGWGKRVAAGAAAVVFCGAVGFGGGYLGYTFAKGGSTGPVIYQAPAASSGTGSAAGGTANTADALSVTEIASKVGPSVVEVTTEAVTTNAFFGQYVQSGAGSGVIITEDGYIITNNHVVSGASQVTVRTSDGTEYPATVVGADSKTDIAVLKIEATGLTPAVVGDSDSLQVGEFTLAVGNPLGELGGTVTDGIISALDREVTVENQTMNLLQTNAAVSPGNSGGGLFNERGELIGIVNAKSSGQNAEGLGFAIPVNTAIQVAEELINNGYVTGRPAMGVTVLSINDAQTAFQYGVNQAGVYVQSSRQGRPAARRPLCEHRRHGCQFHQRYHGHHRRTRGGRYHRGAGGARYADRYSERHAGGIHAAGKQHPAYGGLMPGADRTKNAPRHGRAEEQHASPRSPAGAFCRILSQSGKNFIECLTF